MYFACLGSYCGCLDLMLDVCTCILVVWTCIRAVCILVAPRYTCKVSVYLLDRAWVGGSGGWAGSGWPRCGQGTAGQVGMAGREGVRAAGSGQAEEPADLRQIEASLLWECLQKLGVCCKSKQIEANRSKSKRIEANREVAIEANRSKSKQIERLRSKQIEANRSKSKRIEANRSKSKQIEANRSES